MSSYSWVIINFCYCDNNQKYHKLANTTFRKSKKNQFIPSARPPVRQSQPIQRKNMNYGYSLLIPSTISRSFSKTFIKTISTFIFLKVNSIRVWNIQNSQWNMKIYVFFKSEFYGFRPRTCVWCVMCAWNFVYTQNSALSQPRIYSGPDRHRVVFCCTTCLETCGEGRNRWASNNKTYTS